MTPLPHHRVLTRTRRSTAIGGIPPTATYYSSALFSGLLEPTNGPAARSRLPTTNGLREAP